jgi:predicted enzyme related to lactoylglutathione lyase
MFATAAPHATAISSTSLCDRGRPVVSSSWLLTQLVYCARRRSTAIVRAVPPSLSLIEFPADEPERARRFWAGLLGVELEPRADSEGEGWQTHSGAPAVGVHARGRGPGDSFSLPYFAVSDLAAALEKVQALGGQIIHPGERWAICKDSEATPFALSQR